MSYPTLEQYNEALQHPLQALTDSDLKHGSVATTGLGLPLALCGGFALTYTVKNGNTKHAVRCFHRQSNNLEKRYESISKRLKTLNSPYFVNFEFQSKGVRAGGGLFPIVKMAWASGKTLGEFLEQNHQNAAGLKNLRASLRALAEFLEAQGMAHGDIQPGNVMVADAGKKIQLIDYDGMFVDDLRGLGSAELGHRNFQHPKRGGSTWDSTLDRFSFICLDIAIRALESKPALWKSTNSDGDSIIFKANDFADPDQSSTFSLLTALPELLADTRNFVAICRSAFNKTPTLEDFIAKRNIPSVTASSTAKQPSTTTKIYLAAFPVLNAENYSLCASHIGSKVELIGKIAEVKRGTTKYGKPYVFINFGHWKDNIVKISIWSEGLETMTSKPNEGWIGKWISVTGLMDPPYINKNFNYSHLSISVTQGSQLHQITQTEAKFRLDGSSTRSTTSGATNSNREILAGLKTGTTKSWTGIPSTTSFGKNGPSASSPSSNQALLQKMRGTQSTTPQPVKPQNYTSYNSNTLSQPRPQPPPQPTSNPCFIATAVYGSNAPETNLLRQWRDEILLPKLWGRAFVFIYYSISPKLLPLINRNAWVNHFVKQNLNRLIDVINRSFLNQESSDDFRK